LYIFLHPMPLRLLNAQQLAVQYVHSPGSFIHQSRDFPKRFALSPKRQKLPQFVFCPVSRAVGVGKGYL
jgi:hypothetical protein